MIASRMTALVVIAMTVASAVMTGVPLVVAMPVAVVARVLMADVRPLVVRVDRVMIVANAMNAELTAEMEDSTDAMIVSKVIASRHHPLFMV